MKEANRIIALLEIRLNGRNGGTPKEPHPAKKESRQHLPKYERSLTSERKQLGDETGTHRNQHASTTLTGISILCCQPAKPSSLATSPAPTTSIFMNDNSAETALELRQTILHPSLIPQESIKPHSPYPQQRESHKVSQLPKSAASASGQDIVHGDHGSASEGITGRSYVQEELEIFPATRSYCAEHMCDYVTMG